MADNRILLLCALSSLIIVVNSLQYDAAMHESEETGSFYEAKVPVSRSRCERDCLPKRVKDVNLRFNDKRGTLALLSRDRRTATRDSSDVAFALVYTIRALEESEPFEIRVAELVATGVGNTLAFGVTTRDPSEYEQTPDYYTELKSQSWILSNQTLQYFDGNSWNTTNPNYAPGETMTGDSLAVLKNTDGDIHFFFNGNDLGVAALGIRQPLYGVVDILGDAKMIEID